MRYAGTWRLRLERRAVGALVAGGLRGTSGALAAGGLRARSGAFAAGGLRGATGALVAGGLPLAGRETSEAAQAVAGAAEPLADGGELGCW